MVGEAGACGASLNGDRGGNGLCLIAMAVALFLRAWTDDDGKAPVLRSAWDACLRRIRLTLHGLEIVSNPESDFIEGGSAFAPAECSHASRLQSFVGHAAATPPGHGGIALDGRLREQSPGLVGGASGLDRGDDWSHVVVGTDFLSLGFLCQARAGMDHPEIDQ